MNPIEKKMKEAIEKRQTKKQEKLLKELRKVPVISYACARAGISRSTYYRWLKENPKLIALVETAIGEGIENINDLSESWVIRKIKEGNFAAARYWLKHHKEEYKRKNDQKGQRGKYNLVVDF